VKSPWTVHNHHCLFDRSACRIGRRARLRRRFGKAAREDDQEREKKWCCAENHLASESGLSNCHITVIWDDHAGETTHAGKIPRTQVNGDAVLAPKSETGWEAKIGDTYRP
jgi:hypothetical protein